MLSKVAAVTVVLGALAGGAVYFVVHRFDGGPLAQESGFLDVAPFEVGQTRTFVHARLVNASSREVRVEKIAPQWTLGGSRVEIWVPRPGVRRASDQTPFPSGRADGGPFPPPGTTIADLRPAAGARVAGRRGSVAARLPLLITVTPAQRGCAGFGGLVIEYRNGLRRYRRVMKLAFGGRAARRSNRPGQQSDRLRLCDDVLARLADRSG